MVVYKRRLLAKFCFRSDRLSTVQSSPERSFWLNMLHIPSLSLSKDENVVQSLILLMTRPACHEEKGALSEPQMIGVFVLVLHLS